MEMDEKTLKSITPFSGPPEGAPVLPPQGQTALQVKTAYTTAVRVQEPRDIKKMRDNVLLEAQLAGKGFYFRWVVQSKDGPKIVQGPSIDMAMCLFRHYGNCAYDIAVDEGPTHYYFTATVIDLESGITCPRMFRQRKKHNIGGKMNRDRAADMIFQIGQSKAIRNAIVKSMPGWLIDRAMEVARAAEIASINPEKLAEARVSIVEHFGGEYSVSVERLEAYLGKPIEQITAEDVADLRSVATTIKEGQIQAWEVFPEILGKEPAKEPPPKKEATQPEVITPRKEAPPAVGSHPAQGAGTSSGPLLRTCPYCFEKYPVVEMEEHLPGCQERHRRATEAENRANDPGTGGMANGKSGYLWDRKNWARMRTGKPPKTGFYAWIMANKETLLNAPEVAKNEMRAKWENLYKAEAFPLDVPPPTQGHGGTYEGLPPREPEFEPRDAYKDDGRDYGPEVSREEGPSIFQNVRTDFPGAGELVEWVQGNPDLMAAWRKHLVEFEFTDPEDIGRVRNFLQGQLERETLSNSEKHGD